MHRDYRELGEGEINREIETGRELGRESTIEKSGL
jgi:hypothetical protein